MMTRFQFLNVLHRLHPSYGFRNGLDFNNVPVEDAARLLRDLGFTLFQALLADDPRPNLTNLTDSKGWRALQRPLWGWAWQAIPPPQDLYQLVMKARFQQPNDLWRGRFVHQLALRMQLTQRFRVPESWWELIGQRAWFNLDFQWSVRYAAIEHMKTRVLFSFSELPHPSFHPNSFWLLIALTDPSPLDSYWRFWRRQIVAPTLHRIAVRQCLQEHWAGIWDQWLIITAILHWHKEPKDLPRDLRNAILALPLWQELPSDKRRPASNDDISEKIGLTLARVDDENVMPTWLLDYFRYSRHFNHGFARISQIFG